MIVVLLLGCAPLPGTYLVETAEWSTTCSLGGGGFVEPAPQYLVEAYIESETALWFDDNACTLDGTDFSCADAPVLDPLDASGESVLTVNRAWTGAWSDPKRLAADVAWTTTCEGPACAAVELCDAAWSYTGVNVDDAT